jgi:folate-binding protein YgfZ
MKTNPPGWAEAATAASFGDVRAEAAAALRGTAAMPLARHGFIEIAGADAESFLQGQLSNDLRQLAPGEVQLSSYNSPKGRMLAVLLVLRRADSFLLELERGVLPPVLKRLQLHVLRSKVKLADVTTGIAALGVSGAAAAALLESAGLPAPQQAQAAGALAVVRRSGTLPRFSVSGPAAEVAQLWPRLAASATPAGSAAWSLLEIEAGVPTIYPQTQDRFVPQMCNLDRLGGISFDKGCYTGQEVVARVHYLGAVKRRMTRVRLPQSPPEPGTKLETGEVVDAALHPDGGSAALVVGAA